MKDAHLAQESGGGGLAGWRLREEGSQPDELVLLVRKAQGVDQEVVHAAYGFG
jgi:hypothetical protein